MDITSYLLGKKAGGGGSPTKYKPRVLILSTTNPGSPYQGNLDYEVANVDTSLLTTMRNMFQYDTGVTSLDLSNWNTSNVTRMDSMFAGCSSLTKLNLSSFDSTNLSNIQSMFAGCTKLNELDIRNFDFTKITTYSSLFSNVPTNCLIIVKDNTQKQWINTNFNSYTNVKTVEEYEG